MAFSEEIEVIISIYNSNITITDEPDHIKLITYSEQDYLIKLYLPFTYPNASPLFIFSSLNRMFDKSAEEELYEDVQTIMNENLGSEVLFQIIELCRERVTDRRYHQEKALDARHKTDELLFDNSSLSDDIEEFTQSQCTGDRREVGTSGHHPFSTSTQLTESAPNLCVSGDETKIKGRRETERGEMSVDVCVDIVHGEVVIEKKSSFQAHVCVVKSWRDVETFRETLLQDKRIATATHNIFACRFVCPLSGRILHEHDDDGEAAAGGRLAELLRLMAVENAAVIVTRHFGGVLLGPDRFRFINNAARKLLEREGFGEREKEREREREKVNTGGKGKGKKKKK
eukprot:CAMPEP_0182419032 /NCGR_PEP_ID=MMETSP1167-20130531/3388_1 /TAXON_ID=2988 /ORGANISM="Mallomonas Sp, Strain CCMP3275" /LENGTH=342 /DNA_ID=CAMNT_0024593607 /DNA_START=70 /DNA_END=1098 /DNA_ORIENTATION=-